MIRQIVMIAVFVTCAACSDTTASVSEPVSTKTNVEESKMTEATNKNLSKISGQLQYQDMEGGFLGFIADNGEKYTLRGLDKHYRQNGMRLVVTAVPMDVMPITQFGKVMQIQEVLRADDSEVKPIPRKPGTSLM